MKDNQRVSELVRVVASLDAITLDSDPLDSSAIVAESSVEESVLVGSSDAFVKLASELLRVVVAFEGGGEIPLEDGGIVERGEKMSDGIKFLFDENATVWPVCICITPSSEITKLVQGKLDS